jgi:hypothetical protein
MDPPRARRATRSARQQGAPALTRVAERRGVPPASVGPGRVYYSNPARNGGELRNRFARWADLLREGLHPLKQLPEVPAP